MKRSALQNKQVVILGMAFRAWKVLGTFEKPVPGLKPFSYVISDIISNIIIVFTSLFQGILYLCGQVIFSTFMKMNGWQQHGDKTSSYSNRTNQKHLVQTQK